MTTAHVQVNFRMPAELKDKLEAAAKEAGRSTTAEIVSRLEESFTAPAPDAVMKALARLEYQLAEKDLLLHARAARAGQLARLARLALPFFEAASGDDPQMAEPISSIRDLVDSTPSGDSTLAFLDTDSPVLQRWLSLASDRIKAEEGTAVRESLVKFLESIKNEAG
ncbi:Arc family DNA-binding protein [Achromobacter xylosoxidans]|uniref:Arc family DNA-binding protein n=1 Tax=Alcaligenes xylosoxydans xylosoxydans TaxID=85698 RepID=UPI002447EFEA|nr:Arc family DNA-binding protein [Achromobacter xylosoxidans]MDH0519954.1 Arc family DNA-binding protein [Achromobacter xylosoxidans]MDH0543850.1 Arc family DNA-binding protein [Achromobacter xylosoxidans]